MGDRFPSLLASLDSIVSASAMVSAMVPTVLLVPFLSISRKSPRHTNDRVGGPGCISLEMT